jgi:shikimate 5-dehydrogenase
VPAETPLITRARAEGCMTIGGIEMLVAQAERQFELWTGQRPPAGLFRAAADAARGNDGRRAAESAATADKGLPT